jgi:hypothetical protein
MLMMNFRIIKSLIIVFLVVFSQKAGAPDNKVAYILISEPVDAYERLVKAVVLVESFGDTMSYNLTEQAFGAFQIRPIRLLDYNRRTGSNYKSEDCFNYKVSKEIFLYYAKQTAFLQYETIARNWNGSGVTTLDYWDKVKSHL